MSDGTLFWAWVGGTVVIATAMNSYATWLQLHGHDADEWRLHSILTPFWPLVAPVALLFGIGWCLYWLPKQAMLEVIARRAVLVERERQAKLEADSRRYLDDEALR